MSDGSWWNDNGGGGDTTDYQYNPDQTAAVQNQLDPNTTYSPAGEPNPIDQYNYVADPNAPGGWQSYAPGIFAGDQAAFNNASGQYPDDATAANAIGNSYAQQPSVAPDGSAGFQSGSGWQDYYNQNMAAYSSAQQESNQAAQGWFGLSPETQALFNNTYPGQGQQVWEQQNAANQAQANTPVGQWGPNGFSYGASQGSYPSWMGGGGTPWNNPWSIGANTSEIPWGWGVQGFGQSPQPIDPSYLAILSNPQLAAQLMPGYIPGSGTYNQRPLDTPGLIGMIAGVPSNMAYGSGGVGDPTTGREAQTPDQWVQGGKLFNWTGNMEGNLGYIANLFGRSDTPSGIGTPTWSAPKQYWDGLAQQIAAGRVQPTARGWEALAAKGYTPQNIGGAAPGQAQGVGYGGAGGTGQGPMGAGTQAFNYQAAYLDYLTARMNQLDIPTMNQLNQREQDKLAFDKAKQAWLEQYQQQTFGEGQRQFNELQGLRQGELVGSYNGQQTLASRAEQNQTSLGYLNLLSKLRGPADIFQYLKVLNGTPAGMRDLVNAASGAYRMPTTGGGGVSVGGYSNGADLNSLLDQMNNPNYGAEAQNINLPAPNQISAQNLIRMTPTQRQTLLAAYESAGYSPEDVMSIFQNSLPRYASQGGTGRVNLWR